MLMSFSQPIITRLTQALISVERLGHFGHYKNDCQLSSDRIVTNKY